MAMSERGLALLDHFNTSSDENVLLERARSVVADTLLTQDEKNVLAQALTDYMEGIERTDLSNRDKNWCEDNVSSIERKLLS